MKTLKDALAALRRRRTIALARRGIRMVHAAVQSTHLPRATRRRIMRALAHGELDAEAIMGQG